MKIKDHISITEVKQNASLSFSAGVCSEAISVELANWQKENKIQRLWASDISLWTNSDENNWTGWLTAIKTEENDIQRIKTLADEIKADGTSDCVILGMGGSSLCPAMIADTFGKIEHFPRLHILDSTDPAQIHQLEKSIHLQKTIFIISSKSGSTLETNILKSYFYMRLRTELHADSSEIGAHFIAITDPGTALDKIAQAENFKAIFYGVPTIGGRYSALSNFGMVPAGLMGINVKEFLHHANKMYEACSSSTATENPGVVLGVILGVCAKHGKDKVTLITSPGIYSLGAWLEQLLAESTGKDGKGLIPVDRETLGEPEVYGNDRLFVYIHLEGELNPEKEQAIYALEQSGFVVVRLALTNKMHLGAELFLWEFAVAVAGSVLGINPFNQPDVEESKICALQLTDDYEKTGQLIQPIPFFSEEGIALFADEKEARDLMKELTGMPSIINLLKTFLKQVKENDYIGFSAFIEMSKEHMALLQESRMEIRNRKKAATCLGFGPRFLHSTGQAYKGGPNTGVFLQITSDHIADIPVPNHHYTFGLVIAAQAQADFTVLIKRSRRILRIHLGTEIRNGLERLSQYFQHV